MNQIRIMQPNAISARRSDRPTSTMSMYDLLRYGLPLSSQQAKIMENSFKRKNTKWTKFLGVYLLGSNIISKLERSY